MDALLLRRRAIMAAKKSRLPAEYQEVQYLKFTGTQYINLGTMSAEYPAFDIKYYIQSRVDQYGPHIISSTNYYLWLVAQRAVTLLRIDGISAIPDQNRMTNALGRTITAHLDYANNKFIFSYVIGGVPTTEEIPATLNQVQSSGDMAIGAYPVDPSVSRYYFIGNLYYLRLFDGVSNINWRDLVPCYRKADNKPGMYELISRTFYTNAGTGEFTVGPDVN